MLQSRTKSVVYTDCVRHDIPIILGGDMYRVKDGKVYQATVTEGGIEYVPSISSEMLHRLFCQLPCNQVVDYMVIANNAKRSESIGEGAAYDHEFKFMRALQELN